MCWGSNEFGQLGNGTSTDSPTPVGVAGLSDGVSAISAGGAHTCALTTDGVVKCWGSNGSGQLGIGSTTDSLTPVDVVGLADRVSAVSAGSAHTCAVATGGVKCWGANDYQQLGTGTMTGSSLPVAVAGLVEGIAAVAAGDIHSCALTTASAVLCWGGSDGFPPVDVFADPTVEFSAISVGFGMSCALSTDGSVTCWGGQIGDDPIGVAGLAVGATAVTAGGSHACAVTSGGAAVCWGDNWNGQLGNGRTCSTLSGSAIPVDVEFAAVSPGSQPTATPFGRIEQATGPTDVVLRIDYGPSVAVSDLQGELFQPGPEFTLYGDGRVIFRDHLAALPPADGPILRQGPFLTARLDDDQSQALLRLAFGEGGLAAACEEYPTQDLDGFGGPVITVRAGGVDKRVVVGGPSPLGALIQTLTAYDPGSGVATRVWVPDRYWGNLIDASVFQYIGDGVTPGLAEFGMVAWPWPGVAPVDFFGSADPTATSGSRAMSADEAAVLGLSDDGGVVQRVYLVGPDGATVYYFSLWPMAPDEAATR